MHAANLQETPVETVAVIRRLAVIYRVLQGMAHVNNHPPLVVTTNFRRCFAVPAASAGSVGDQVYVPKPPGYGDGDRYNVEPVVVTVAAKWVQRVMELMTRKMGLRQLFTVDNVGGEGMGGSLSYASMGRAFGAFLYHCPGAVVANFRNAQLFEVGMGIGWVMSLLMVALGCAWSKGVELKTDHSHLGPNIAIQGEVEVPFGSVVGLFAAVTRRLSRLIQYLVQQEPGLRDDVLYQYQGGLPACIFGCDLTTYDGSFNINPVGSELRGHTLVLWFNNSWTEADIDAGYARFAGMHHVVGILACVQHGTAAQVIDRALSILNTQERQARNMCFEAVPTSVDRHTKQFTGLTMKATMLGSGENKTLVLFMCKNAQVQSMVGDVDM